MEEQMKNIPVWVWIIIVLIAAFGKHISPLIKSLFGQSLNLKKTALEVSRKHNEKNEAKNEERIRELTELVRKKDEEVNRLSAKYARVIGMLEALEMDLKRNGIDTSILKRYIDDRHEDS